MVVDQAGKPGAFLSVEVHAGPAVRRVQLSDYGPRGIRNECLAALAKRFVLPECGGGDVPESCGTECNDQTCAKPCSGFRDGRLVPFLGHGKLDGWKGRVSLRDRVVADAIRHWRSSGDRRSGSVGNFDKADETVDGRRIVKFQLLAVGSWLLANPSGASCRGTHPSKTAKGVAASIEVIQQGNSTRARPQFVFPSIEKPRDMGHAIYFR